MTSFRRIKFCLILSFSVHAHLGDMIRELITNNSAIYNSKAKIEKSQNEIDAFYAKMPWSFFYEGAITENKRDYLIEFINYNAEYWSNEFSLEKEFIFGGKFKYRLFSSNQYRFPNNAAVKMGEPAEVYELLQNFNFVQNVGKNFFGREQYKELEIKEKDKTKSEMASDLEIENKVLEFYRSYIDARLLKTLVLIEDNALNRAKQRVQAILKMVRDGLRMKVDLLETKYSLIEHQENRKKAIIALGAALENLSNLLHRVVKEEELEPLKPFKKIFPLSLGSQGRIEDNKNILLLQTQADVLRTTLDKINYGFFPELNIVGDYLSNAIEPTRSQTISKAFFGPGFEIKGSINLRWPLGFEEKEVERTRSKIDLNILQMERNANLNNLKNSEKYIFFRLKNIEDALLMGKERWGIAKEVVSSYNKLYSLGRTGILESLTAEENRIFTERSYMVNLAEREKLYASLAYLWGKLKEIALTIQ